VSNIEKELIKVGELEWFYREAKPVNETDKLPVVLLHGLVSQSYSWTQVLPDLAAQGFRAIAPDWIGFGFSGKPTQQNFAYTPEAFVSSLSDFIEALNLEKIHLVVQGFLGSVGLQYALRHPEKIARLAILNTPVSTAAKLPWKIKQMGLPLIGEMITQDPLLVDRTLEAGSRYKISDEDLDVYRKPFLKTSAAGRSLLSTIRNLQLEQSMAEIEFGFQQWDKPTLIFWGILDPWLPVSQAHYLASKLAQVELVKIEQAGHYPQEHWSEKVSNTLIPFLRQRDN